jgi:hypothetical protein
MDDVEDILNILFVLPSLHDLLTYSQYRDAARDGIVSSRTDRVRLPARARGKRTVRAPQKQLEVLLMRSLLLSL